jgi:23S rRNA (adenine2503-C2)-methyltransferase
LEKTRRQGKKKQALYVVQRMSPSKSIYDLDRVSLESLLKTWGEPAYRTRQIWEWLYVHLANDWDQLTNLPKSLREKMAEQMNLDILKVTSSVLSEDGKTRKDLLRLADGETVEAVLMYYEKRRTACISTQVGCAIGCSFCATGQMGFHRDLTSGEIMAQALHFARLLKPAGERLSNVVLMGMGEPLLNYDATLEAIRRMIDPRGFQLGQRHITLSTVGIVPGIERLTNEPGLQHDTPLQITLAISLHAATDDLRDQLVPINRQYNLDDLFEACYKYTQHTGRRVSFEWALIAGTNDTSDQAHALAARLKGIPAHVNLISLNPTSNFAGQPPTPNALSAFAAKLKQHHIPYTLRLRRGIDIQAGCGQLRQYNQKT